VHARIDMPYKVTYFPAKGRGERVRLTLACLGQTFEDERIPADEFAKRKAAGELPLGFLPVLTIDGKQRLSNSIAIMWYLATKHGALIPKDDLLRARVFAVMNSVEDRFPAFVGMLFAAEKEPLIAKEIPHAQALVGNVDRCSTGTCLVGDELSLADLVFFDWVQQADRFIGTVAMVNASARLKAAFSHFLESPRVKAFQAGGPSPAPAPKTGVYFNLIRFKVKPYCAPAFASTYSENIFPAFKGAKGLLSQELFPSEDGSYVMSLTRWVSKADYEAGAEKAKTDEKFNNRAVVLKEYMEEGAKPEFTPGAALASLDAKGGRGAGYCKLIRFHAKPDCAAKFAATYGEYVLPAFKEQKGLRSYEVFPTDDNTLVFSLSRWDTQAECDAAIEHAKGNEKFGQRVQALTPFMKEGTKAEFISGSTLRHADIA